MAAVDTGECVDDYSFALMCSIIMWAFWLYTDRVLFHNYSFANAYCILIVNSLYNPNH